MSNDPSRTDPNLCPIEPPDPALTEAVAGVDKALEKLAYASQTEPVRRAMSLISEARSILCS